MNLFSLSTFDSVCKNEKHRHFSKCTTKNTSQELKVWQLHFQSHNLGDDGKVLDEKAVLISEKDIRKHSLLTKTPSLKDSLLQNSNENIFETVLRILTNFMGGGFLTGGSEKREGITAELNYTIWLSTLEELEKNLPHLQANIATKQLIKKLKVICKNLLEHAKELNELAKQTNASSKILDWAEEKIKAVQDLSIGESLPLHAGWLNRSGAGGGHALIFQIVRKTEESLDLLIHTSTAFHNEDHYIAGKKIRLVPLIRYTNIPFNNSTDNLWLLFLQGLIELNTTASSTSADKINVEHVLHLCAPFDPYWQPVSIAEVGISTGQRGGTCAPSATKELVRYMAKSLEVDKQLIFHIKFSLLCALYATVEKELQEDSKEAAELRQAFRFEAAKLQLRTAKALQGCAVGKPLITAGFALQVRATAHDLENRVNAIETKLQKLKKPLPCLIEQSEVDYQRHIRNLLDCSIEKPFCTDFINSCPLIHHVDIIKSPLKAVKETLENIENIGASSHTEKTSLQQMQIAHCIDQLPIPLKENRAFWKNLSLEDQQQIAENLCKLVEIYSSSNLYHTDSISRRLANILPLQAVLHYLTLQIDNALMEKEAVPEAYLKNYAFPSYTECLQLENIQFYNKKEFERLIDAAKYFTKEEQRTKQKPQLFANEENSQLARWSVEKSSANGIYWQALTASKPNLKEKALQKAVSYNDCKDWSNEEIEQDLQKQQNNLKGWEIAFQEFQQNKSLTLPNKPTCRQHYNLSEATKLTLALEAHHPASLLQQEWPHVALFRKALFAIHFLLTYETKYEDFIRVPARIEKHLDNINIISYEKQSSWAPLEQFSSSQRPCLSLKTWLSRPAFSRNSDLWNSSIAEGQTLRDTPKFVGLLQRIERTLSQRKISPLQQLHEITKELDQLENSDIQGALLSLFFRAPYSSEKKRFWLGVGETICQNQALVEESAIYIRRSLAKLQSLHPFPSKGISFFLELAFHMAHYLCQDKQFEKAKLLCLKQEINIFLERSDLTEEQKSLLYFYRLSFRLLQNTIDDNEYADIFADWIASKQTPQVNSTERSPILSETVKRLYIACLTELSYKQNIKQWVFEKGEQVFSKITKKQQAPSKKWFISEKKFPIITDGISSIDLLEGTVYSPEGRLSPIVNSSFPWEKQEDFERLFGKNINFHYHLANSQTVLFTHPLFGNFRLLKQRNDSYVIQKEIQGIWYQHCPIDTLKTNKLPYALIYDHACWVNPNAPSLLTNLKDQKPVYQIKKGVITTVNNSSPLEVDFADGDKILSLTRFEKGRYILIFRKPTITSERKFTGEISQQISKVSFPRYTSIDNTPLQFVFQQNKWVWSDNRNYHLAKKMPQGMVGKIQSYLFLESKDNNHQGLLLFPIQPIKIKKQKKEPSLAPEQKLYTSHKNIFFETNNEQVKTQKYVAIEWKNGHLHPTSREGELFLAYLWLSQKKYSEAVRLITKPLPIGGLSQVSKTILKMLYTYPLGDDHPNGKAVRLHAWLQNFKAVYCQNPGKKNLVSLPKNIPQDFADILQNDHNLATNCRFSHDEEVTLLEEIIFFSEAPNSLLQQLKARLKTIKERQKQPITKIHEGKHFIQKLDWPSSCYWTYKKSDTDWLDNEFPSSEVACEQIQQLPCISRPSGIRFDKNGKIFMAIYRVAKSTDFKARIALLQRLTLWRLSDKYNRHLACLQFVVLMPSKFPDIPTVPILTPEHKYNLLLEVESAYNSATKPSSICWKTLLKVEAKPDSFLLDENRQKSAYPILFDSEFDNQPIKQTTTPLNLKFSSQSKRWQELKAWEQLLEIPLEAFTPSDNNFSFSFEEELLSQGERHCKKAVQRDLKILQADYDFAKASYNPSKTLSKKNASILKECVEGKMSIVKSAIKATTIKILTLVNTHKTCAHEQEEMLAKMAGNAKNFITLEDCFTMLRSGKQEAFQTANPSLTTEAIDELTKDLLCLLDNLSYEAQLSRILELCNKLAKVTEPALQRALCHQLEIELVGKYHFENLPQEDQLIFRIFAAKTGILPFKKQVDLIELMLKQHPSNPQRLANLVIQLIMGGGKSSVIATLLLYLIARKSNRIACILVPQALFTTAAANLHSSLLQAFDQHIHPIEMTRQDFTLEKLEHLKQTLEKMKNESLPAICNATTLQGFELEMLSLSRKIARKQQAIDALEEKIQQLPEKEQQTQKTLLQSIKKEKLTEQKRCCLLEEIISCFQNHAEAIFDEVDLLFDCFQQVIFVDSEKMPIDQERSTLLRTIFQAMASNELFLKNKGETVSVKDFLRLPSNEQSQVDPHTFIKQVAPLVAKYVAVHFKPIQRTIGNHLNAYVRFVTGQIPSALEKWRSSKEQLTKQKAKAEFFGVTFETLQADLSFLHHLEALYQNPKSRPAANHIALTKHFLCDVLKTSLAKTGGRNYGPSPRQGEIGKQIPYKGLDYPEIFNDIGYHHMAAACSYQWGLAFPPFAESIKEIAATWMATANHYIQESGMPLSSTPEYEEFFELFGVPIDRIEQPGIVEEAMKNVSDKHSTLLELQEILISRFVHITPESLASTGFDLANLTSSQIGMSGTPWNVEGYFEELVKNYKADIGTEGKILHQLAVKISNDKILDVDFAPPYGKPIDFLTFLQQMYKKIKDPKKIQGIIEAGALFKRFGSNSDIAQCWANFLYSRQELEKDLPSNAKTVDPNIEGVLFFDKDPNGDTTQRQQPNTLYAWRFGLGKVKIGSSTPQALSAKGFNSDNYVVFYDEKHTTGSDIKQKANAVNILTFDQMLLRNVTQSVMRLRGFLLEQDVVIVMDSNARKNLYNQGKSVADLIIQSAKTQSLRKTEAIMRFLSQQIAHLTRKSAVTAIREKIAKQEFDSSFAKEVLQQEEFFVTQFTEEPYLQHGYLQTLNDSKEHFITKIDKHLQRYLTINTDKNNKELENAAENLKKWIKQHPAIPKQWYCQSGDNDLDQETLQQIEVQTEININVEIEEEIELALEAYNAIAIPAIREEKKMSFMTFLSLIQELSSENPSGGLMISLKNQLKAYPYTFEGKKARYDELFVEPLYGTHAFFFSASTSEVIPIFHRMQRPPKQILVCRTEQGKLHYLFLSEREAGAAASHLKRLYESENELRVQSWLIQADGSSYVKTKNSPLFPIKEAEQCLLEINAFAGHLDYFHSQEKSDQLEAWLQNRAELKINFLKLKALSLNDPLQKKSLLSSEAIASVSEKKSIKKGSSILCKRRLERRLLSQGNFQPSSPLNAKLLLDPEKIQELNVGFIRYLGIVWSERKEDNFTNQALQTWIYEDPTLQHNEKALEKKAFEHSQKQLTHIQPWHYPYLTPGQISLLPDNQVAKLSTPEEITRWSLSPQGDVQITYLLKKEQLQALTETQSHLIAAIDPGLYEYFDKEWQIKAISPSQIDKINPSYGKYLTAYQLQNITPSLLTQNKEFSFPFVKSLRDDQINQIPKILRFQLIEDITSSQIDTVVDVKKELFEKIKELGKKESPKVTQKALANFFNKLKDEIVSSQRFCLSRLADKVFSCAELQLNDFDITASTEEIEWKKVTSITKQGVTAGSLIGTIGAVGAAAITPIGLGIGLGMLVLGGSSAAVYYSNKANNALLYQSVNKAIKKHIDSSALRQLLHSQSCLAPLESPAWPHNPSRIDILVTATLNDTWKTYVQHINEQVRLPISGAASLESKHLFSFRHITKLANSGSRMRLRIDSSSYLTRKDISLIPKNVQANSSEENMKSLLTDYEEILQHRLAKGKAPTSLNKLLSLFSIEPIDIAPMDSNFPWLLLPKVWLEECDKLFTQNLPLEIGGNVQMYKKAYSFVKKDSLWEWSLHYLPAINALKGEPNSENLPVGTIKIATIDNMTINSYRKLLWNQDRLETQSPCTAEFLLQALYGKSLPGYNSNVIKNTIVAPQEVLLEKPLFTWLAEEKQKLQCFFDCSSFKGIFQTGKPLEFVIEEEFTQVVQHRWKKKSQELDTLAEKYSKEYQIFTEKLSAQTEISFREIEKLIPEKLKLPPPKNWKEMLIELNIQQNT